MEDKMKKIRKELAFLLAVLLVVGAAPALADGEKSADKRRAKIDARSNKVLNKVLEESELAKEFYDKAMGYAVFETTKAALGVSGGGGNGVAVEKASGTRTYMKMATAGVGFGLGIKRYQVIMLFENETVFQEFIDKGWQAEMQAAAAAGSEGMEFQKKFHEGMMVFVRTKKGLMARADVSGTKYWKSELND
jgi:lipid-binding SYLF domain-containing protein